VTSPGSDDAGAASRPGRPNRAILAALSAATFLALMLPSFNRAYGYFIDEFYYLACSRRLAFGYVDHPPLSPLLLAISNATLGTSVPAIRFLPALAIALTVFLAGLTARRLGGGAFAQTLAALAVMASPIVLVIGGLFTVNALEILIWTTACYIVLRILQTGRSRLWLVFGVVAGLGLENKHTTILLGAGLLVGLALTPARRHLRSRWFWLGGLTAFGLLIPNLLWQAANGWPSLEFYRNAELYKNVPTPPLQVLVNQAIFHNPFAFPVWLAGLYFFLTRNGGRSGIFGWAYLVLLAVVVAAGTSRPDRIAGIYPVLAAGGAVWWEGSIARRKRRWLRPLLTSLVAVGGLVLAPICLPILPPETAARYGARLGVVPQIERGQTSSLPQWLADRFDWEEMVAATARVYRALSPEEQRGAVIAAPTYGHAGAIELFAKAYGLPRVISAHNSYFLWGRNEPTPQVLIAIGADEDQLRSAYESVEHATTIEGTYCMSWRRDTQVFVARRPKLELQAVWGLLKNFE
jgi:4-amino-4-deoxy-L-arabinose transferase-like glycosyltransferase